MILLALILCRTLPMDLRWPFGPEVGCQANANENGQTIARQKTPKTKNQRINCKANFTREFVAPWTPKGPTICQLIPGEDR